MTRNGSPRGAVKKSTTSGRFDTADHTACSTRCACTAEAVITMSDSCGRWMAWSSTSSTARVTSASVASTVPVRESGMPVPSGTYE